MWSTSTILEVLFWTGLLVAYLTYAPSHKDTSWSRPKKSQVKPGIWAGLRCKSDA